MPSQMASGNTSSSSATQASSSRVSDAAAAVVVADAAMVAGSSSQLLPQLQQLALDGVRVPVSTLQQVSHITRLTSLRIENTYRMSATAGDIPRKQQLAALHGVLSNLPNLLELFLSSAFYVNPLRDLDQPLKQVSTMQHLQRLSFDGVVCSSIRRLLPSLPASLTYLGVRGTKMTPDPEDLSAAKRLSSLERVELQQLPLCPDMLGNWPALKHLCLRDVGLIGSGLGAGIELELQVDALLGIGVQGSDVEGSLLRALGQLTQLQHLSITDTGDLGHAGSTGDFCALTASSHLTALILDSKRHGSMPLPQDALGVAFKAGRLLPGLRKLALTGDAGDNDEGCYCIDDINLSSIAECCPQLAELALCHVMDPDSERMEGLLGFETSLREFELAGAPCGEAAAAVVAQLTNLTLLHIRSSHLPDAGLGQLTALQGLQDLVIHDCDALAGLPAKYRLCGLHLKPTVQSAAPSSTLSVRQQLLRILGQQWKDGPN